MRTLSVLHRHRRETIRHVDAARSATTMRAMHDEMDRYLDDMMPMMADMDATMDGMSMHCDGLGMGDMRAMHGGLDGEMSRHASSMEAILDLGPAQAETVRHGDAMFAMMDGMDGAMGNMRCH